MAYFSGLSIGEQAFGTVAKDSEQLSIWTDRSVLKEQTNEENEHEKKGKRTGNVKSVEKKGGGAHIDGPIEGVAVEEGETLRIEYPDLGIVVRCDDSHRPTAKREAMGMLK